MATDSSKKIIQDLSIGLLTKLGKAVLKEIPEDANKKHFVAGIINEVEKIGVKRLADSLKVGETQEICETLKIDFKESSKHSKNVLSKRLRVRVERDGLEEVLSELKPEQQSACFDVLSLAGYSKASTNRAVAIRIAAEVRRIGVEVVLSKMDMAFLREVGEELGLDLYDVTSQPQVIKAIIVGKVPTKRPRVEPKQEKISKKKPKLEAGISVADMMQYYNLDELQDFAKDNGVSASGKKKELMKRLAAHFAGEEPPAKKAKTEKKEKKKEKKEKKEKEEEKEKEKEKVKEDEAEKEKEAAKKAEAKKEKEEAAKAKKEEAKAKKEEAAKAKKEKDAAAKKAKEEEAEKEKEKEKEDGKRKPKKTEEKEDDKVEEKEKVETPKTKPSPKGKGKKGKGKKEEATEVGER